MENDLGLHRDSEKFEYRDEEHLQEIIQAIKIFLRWHHVHPSLL